MFVGSNDLRVPPVTVSNRRLHHDDTTKGSSFSFHTKLPKMLYITVVEFSDDHQLVKTVPRSFTGHSCSVRLCPL